MKKYILTNAVSAAALSLGLAVGGISHAMTWSLKDAAAPYSGTTVDVVFLLRPGYEAIEAMLPAFEDETGIQINIIKHPYENALGDRCVILSRMAILTSR